MKKWILLISIVFSSLLYSKGIYFSEPTSSHVDYIGTGGEGPIAYSFYHANGIVVYSYYARLTYPDASQSDWMVGETGGWWVSKAGTYQIEGKAWVESIFGGGPYWAYRNPFSFSVVDNYAPSAPQNLQVINNNGNPGLTWNANTEADLAGYNVYRNEAGNGWGNIAFTSNAYYTDYGVDINTMSLDEIEYKITAVDYNGSKESTYSNVVSIIGTLKKNSIKTEANSFNEFQLDQNYPNPFNPSTVISYNLTKNSFVSLKVYDILGNEVATLVNEPKNAGSHSIRFDASNLSSGLYLYKLTAGSYSEQKKMILMK